jgi:hypothetical protein
VPRLSVSGEHKEDNPMRIMYYHRSIHGGEIVDSTTTELSHAEMHERAPANVYFDPNPPIAVLERWRLKQKAS